MIAGLEHCEECRTRDAAFEVQERRTAPEGDNVGTKAPWIKRLLCAGCTNTAVASDDPPRRVTALHPAPAPTHPLERTEALTLGDDWGTS